MVPKTTYLVICKVKNSTYSYCTESFLCACEDPKMVQIHVWRKGTTKTQPDLIVQKEGV